MTDLVKQAESPLAAPVEAVLVLEDRAHVTRALTLELAAGQHRLQAGPVTPLAVERSLRCRVRPTTGAGPEGRLLDLELAREYRVRARRPGTSRL